MLLFAAIFVISLLTDKITIRNFFKIYISTTTLQSFITVVSFFYLPFFNFIQNIQIMDERSLILHYVRATGLGFGFDSGAMILSFSMLMLMYLYLTSKHKFIYIFLYLFHLFAGIFVARTIFVGCAASIFFLLFYPEKHSYKKKLFFFFIALIIISLIVSYIFTVLSKEYSSFISWAFEFFMKKESRVNRRTSLDVIFGDMYFLPEDFRTWVIGDGKLIVNGTTYRNTDSGYMNLLLLMGIPGIVLYLSVNIICLKSLKTKDRKLNWLFISFFCLNLVFFLKLMVYHFTFIAFVLIGLSYKQKKQFYEI
jgi:hypothetical protein